MAHDATTHPRSALPRASERLLPWLGAVAVVAGLGAVVAFTGGASAAEGAVLILGLVGVLAVTGLVVARSSSAAVAVEREERDRPSLEELFAADEAFGEPPALPPMRYFQGMERWTEAMLELAEHALAAPDAPRPVVGELEAAAAATRDLHGLLRSTIDEPISINGMATLHGVCATWEADQARVEQLGADVDGPWHQRWAARTVAERRLRRGGRPTTAMVLPYRS